MMMAKAGNGPATRTKVKAKVASARPFLPQYEEEVGWKQIGKCRETLDEEDKDNVDNQHLKNEITANSKQANKQQTNAKKEEDS
eukprot:14749547-Ditylum_brightwellii.AAC.1